MRATGPEGPDRWGDLGRRVLSAAVLAILAGVPLLLPPPWLQPAMGLLVVMLVGGVFWELERLCAPARRAVLWPFAAGATALWVAGVGVAGLVNTGTGVTEPGNPSLWISGVAVMLGVLILGAYRATRSMRRGWNVFGVATLVAAITLYDLRLGHGVLPVLWLVGTVILSDVLGYFAGRSLGGPKFWPRLSPKKTWSGTIAGWLGAAVLGLALAVWGVAGWSVAALGPLIALAGQMGDIAESALKRRAGVKDSSDMIPGHGGLMDRFDAMTGALVLAFVLLQAGLFPHFGA